MSRWSTQRHGTQHLPGTILPGVPLTQFITSQPSRVVDDSAAHAVEAELVHASEPAHEAFDEIVQHPGGRPAPIVDAEIITAAITAAPVESTIAPAATEAERFAAETAALAGPWSEPGSPSWPSSIPSWGRAPRGYGRALAQVPTVVAPRRSQAAASRRDLVGHAS